MFEEIKTSRSSNYSRFMILPWHFAHVFSFSISTLVKMWAEIFFICLILLIKREKACFFETSIIQVFYIFLNIHWFKKRKKNKNRKSFFKAFFIAELVLSNNKKVYAQIKNLLKHIDMFWCFFFIIFWSMKISIQYYFVITMKRCSFTILKENQSVTQNSKDKKITYHLLFNYLITYQISFHPRSCHEPTKLWLIGLVCLLTFTN